MENENDLIGGGDFEGRIEEILNSALKALDAGQSYDLKLEDLGLKIRLKGPAWGRIVDKPIARFLLDLDERLQEEMKRLGMGLPAGPHGVVALRIEEGSLEAFLQYSKGFLKEWKKMKTKEQLIIASMVLGALTVWKGPEIIRSWNEVEVEQQRSEERVELVKAVAGLEERRRDVEAPVRKLLAKLDEDDRVQLPGMGSAQKPEVAREKLASGKRSSVKSYYIDGRYIVDGLTTREPGRWQVKLRYGEIIFRAEVRLVEDEVQELLKQFQEAHKKGNDIAPDFLVTADVNQKGIQRAEVIGMGQPRDKAVKLSDALSSKDPKSNGKEEGSQ